VVVVEPALRALSAGTVIANNYRVISELGSGGMGTVFLAENVTLQQEVVVKVLRDVARGAGAAEARVLAALDHPNVVHVYAYDERFDCIVMQRLRGQSLQDTAFPEGGRAALDFISSLRVVRQTALALEAVHERGIVHRDVKPLNVMVDFTGGEVKWVKLIDFGTALRVGRTIDPPAGTLDFCPPEQFDPSVGAQPGNDVYALGVTLFYLCTGTFPFAGTDQEIIQGHLGARPPELTDVFLARRGLTTDALDPHLSFAVEQVSELMQRMLAKEPEKRPSARDVAFRLSDVIDHFSSTGTHVGARPMPLQLTNEVKKAQSTVVLPSRRVGTATAEAIAALARPQRNRTAIVIGGVVLALLMSALLFFNPPAGDRVEAPIDAGVAVVAAPTPVVEGPAAIDAGLAVVQPTEPLELLNPLKPQVPIKKPEPKLVVVKPAPACQFDDGFRSYARQATADLQRLSGGNAGFSKLEDALSAAMVDRDCHRVNKILADMRRTAGVREDE